MVKRHTLRKKSHKKYKTPIRNYGKYKKSLKSVYKNNKHKMQKGGGNPFIGYPFDGGKPETWPGVMAAAGVPNTTGSMANYYPLSPNGVGAGGVEYPVNTNLTLGGKRRKSSRKKHTKKFKKIRKHGKSKKHKKSYKARKYRRYKNQKGGGIGQDIVDLGRNALIGTQNLYNSIAGNPPYASPNPTDQPIGQNVKVISYNTP